MKKHNIILFAAIFVSAFAFSSCREGIIDPHNSVGNVNEPVVFKSSDAYTFQIDAKNITFTKTDETFLDITETDVVLTLKDYSGGSVFVKVIADNLSTLYDGQLAENISGKQTSVINHIADKVHLEFNNFSGNLRIQLVKTPRNF